jgi:hypothetical protein
LGDNAKKDIVGGGKGVNKSRVGKHWYILGVMSNCRIGCGGVKTGKTGCIILQVIGRHQHFILFCLKETA